MTSLGLGSGTINVIASKVNGWTFTTAEVVAVRAGGVVLDWCNTKSHHSKKNDLD